MTWKEAFKFIFHLFNFITVFQLLFLFFTVEINDPFVGEVSHRVVLRVFLLAAATSLPMLILIGSEIPSRLEFWTRRLTHFALTAGILIGVLMYFEWIAALNMVVVTISFVIIYGVATIIWHIEDIRIAGEINKRLTHESKS